jgi:hypothetical protein
LLLVAAELTLVQDLDVAVGVLAHRQWVDHQVTIVVDATARPDGRASPLRVIPVGSSAAQ